MAKILITSALPYVNNIPHLGNLIGSTLSADVFTRHKRLQGHEVLFVCGADEHGTATETKAREEGIDPQALCDKYEEKHREIYQWFQISFDIWGRTHTKTQERITQEIFLDLHKNGYIDEKDVDQLYDEQVNQFLADRFVEGQCPYCNYPKARGDQCDSCGKLINAPDLINPISKLSGSKPVIKTSRHLFLNLPKLRAKLDPWLDTVKNNWSKNTQKITENWLRDLKERAITRDLSWGVPVPLEGFENKVFYVWFDAPIGYIGITAHANENWKDWWQSKDVSLFQFMGKDNVVFHSVIFPSTLLGTSDQWTLVRTISTTEFLNMEGGKFSKSRKQGVFGDDAIAIAKKHPLPADTWRYYLLAIRPETADTQFSWMDFQRRINNELIANIGNLVHRVLHFSFTKCADVETDLIDQEFVDACAAEAKQVITLLDETKLRDGLHAAMGIAKKANQYFQDQQPWASIKSEPEKAHRTVRTLLTVVKDLSILFSPFIPVATQYIQQYLGGTWSGYHEIGQPLQSDIFKQVQKPAVLFHRFEDEVREELQKKYSQQGTAPLDLRVARIESSRAHPKADRLLLLDINLGEEKRQLVAGLADHYAHDELPGKNIVVVANLEHAVLRGEKSEGMLLAGDKDGSVGLLLAPDAEPGTRLTIGGREGANDKIPFNTFKSHAIEAKADGVFVNGERVEGTQLKVDRDILGPLR